MHKLIFIFSLLLLVSCSNTSENELDKVVEQIKSPSNPTNEASALVNDTAAEIIGIGGIFYYSKDPTKTQQWYRDNLGMKLNNWGASFESRNARKPEERNYLQWTVFPEKSEYLSPSNKDFMINYRVRNLEKLVARLRANGVTILDTLKEYDFGKFIHIMDADSTKIELWEPRDTVLTKMGGPTNK